MIRTVLKHEVHRTKRPLFTVLGIGTLVCLVAFAIALAQIPVVSPLSAFLAVSAPVIVVFLVMLGLAVDLYNSSFGDQRYLTHLVPIPSPKLMWMKFGYAAGVTLFSLLWALVVFALVAPSTAVSSGASLGQTWRAQWASVGDFLGNAPAWVLVALPIAILVMTICYVATIYFAVSVGSELRFHRRGSQGPAIVFVGVYLALQVAMLIGIVITPVALDLNELALRGFEIRSLFADNPDFLPLGFIWVLLVAVVVLMWRTHVSWRSKIALR